jgi:hypothetical protein
MNKIIKETIYENVERCHNMTPLQFGDILYPIGSMQIQRRVVQEFEDYTTETLHILVYKDFKK